MHLKGMNEPVTSLPSDDPRTDMAQRYKQVYGFIVIRYNSRYGCSIKSLTHIKHGAFTNIPGEICVIRINSVELSVND